MNEDARFLAVSGAAAIGLFVIGKAAVDHALESRRDADQRDTIISPTFGVSESELDDVVAYVAGIGGIIATVKGLPILWKELTG